MTRILVVDDKPDNVYLLQVLLQGHGYDVETARHGAEALAKARQQAPALIVSDLLMPVMDGYTLLTHWRADARLRDIPFLVYTATYTEPQDEQLALSLGADAFVVKPAEPHAVLAHVQRLLAGGRPSLNRVPPPRGGELERYSQIVVRKLEEKTLLLEEANEKLAKELAEHKLADEKLRESTERLRLAIQASNVGFWDWDLRSNSVEYSREWKAQLGYEEHEIGDTFAEWERLVHPEDLRPAIERVGRYLAAPSGPYEAETRMRHKDGSYRWIRVRAELVRDAKGVPVRMLGSHQDVTERRNSREMIVRERDLFEQIVNSLPGVFYVFRPNDRFLRWNHNFERVTGYGPDELKDMQPLDLFRGADRSYVEERIARVFEHGESDAEASMIAKDGSAHPHYFTGRRIEYDGAPAVIGMGVDISELRLARDLAIKERDLSAQIVNSLPGVFYMLNDQRRFVRWNENFERVTEYTGEELSRLHPTDLTLPQDHERAQRVLEDVFEHDSGVDIELDLVAKSGRRTPYHFTGRAVVIDGGRFLIGVGFDLSERRRAADVQQKLQEQLRQAQKMEALGALAGGIAHDFNNLLSTILGNARLAVDDVRDPKALLESLSEILSASNRAKDLVQRILVFSRPQEEQLQPLQLAPVLEEVVRLLKSTLPAGVDLNFQASAGLPIVRADPSQIHQVIMNLATNAWHAMDGRGGRIDIRAEPCEITPTIAEGQSELRPGAYVRLTVSDTGHGMDAATRERIFEPFFTTKAPGEGTGLGLSVVHGIVRSHGGAILVDSEPGRGSTFRLYFPAWAGAVEAAAPLAPPREAPASLRGEGHILYLDDEEPLVYLVERHLQRLGYRVTGHTRAVDALNDFRKDPESFDLVITDSNMPGMSGIEVARQLLTIRPDAPIVLTSGYLRSDEIEAASALGVREVLLKPNTVDELGPIVRRLIGDRPTRRRA